VSWGRVPADPSDDKSVLNSTKQATVTIDSPLVSAARAPLSAWVEPFVVFLAAKTRVTYHSLTFRRQQKQQQKQQQQQQQQQR